MAATSGGALKAAIEGLGLAIAVYRDRAPEGMSPPYVSVIESIALVPDGLEDGSTGTGRETVQIDIWMPWKGADGKMAETYALPRQVARGLHGQSLLAAPTRAYAVLVRRIGPRLVEEEENLVHVPITAVICQVI